MIELSREVIAYAIIGTICAIGLPWAVYVSRRRKREKLRRAGVKTYGH